MKERRENVRTEKIEKEKIEKEKIEKEGTEYLEELELLDFYKLLLCCFHSSHLCSMMQETELI